MKCIFLRILLVLFIIYVFLYIFILLFLPATTESASGSSLRMQSNKKFSRVRHDAFHGRILLFYFCPSFPAGPFCSSTIPLNVVARLASPCRSDGTTIFVAFPFARTPSASRLFKVRTASSAPASLMARIPSAFACCTLRIASAWPSASRIRFSFLPQHEESLPASLPLHPGSQTVFTFGNQDGRFFSPSAIRIASRRSRSAFICFSMAS